MHCWAELVLYTELEKPEAHTEKSLTSHIHQRKVKY